DDDRDVERACQGAVADARGKEGGQRGGHDPDQEVEKDRNQQQADENEPDIVVADQLEGRKRENQQAQAADQQEGLAADLVAEKPHDGLHEQHAYHDHDDDEHAMVFGVAQAARQIGGHVGQKHVIGDVGRQNHADAHQQSAAVLRKNFK